MFWILLIETNFHLSLQPVLYAIQVPWMEPTSVHVLQVTKARIVSKISMNALIQVHPVNMAEPVWILPAPLDAIVLRDLLAQDVK